MAGEDRGDLGSRRSIRAGAPAQAAVSRSAQSASGRSASAKSSAREHIFVVAGWLAVLLVFGGSWQIAATHGLVDPVFTGMPTRIVFEFLRSLTGPPLTVDTFATVTAALIGSGIASIVGVACAFALAQSDVWRRIFDPYFTILNGLPRVALAPLFLLWFGIGPTSKIMLAASITFFVMFYNTMAGVDSVDRDHLLLARAIRVRHAGDRRQRDAGRACRSGCIADAASRLVSDGWVFRYAAAAGAGDNCHFGGAGNHQTAIAAMAAG
jgi:ABC-type anion transport system duplicated permease subunit